MPFPGDLGAWISSSRDRGRAHAVRFAFSEWGVRSRSPRRPGGKRGSEVVVGGDGGRDEMFAWPC